MDRFGAFSRDARQSLENALSTAEGQGDLQVGLRHLLLGLASLEHGEGGPIRGSGFDAGRLRVEFNRARSMAPTTLSIGTRNVIERTISEAAAWLLPEVSAAHLTLCALTAEDDEARVALAEGGGHVQTALDIAAAQTRH